MFRINEGYFQRLNPDTQEYAPLVVEVSFELDTESGRILVTNNGMQVLVRDMRSENTANASRNWFAGLNEKGFAIGI